MASQMICDLCGKPIDDTDRCRRFRVKEKKSLFYESWWEPIDVHRDCLKAVLEAVREKQTK